MKLKKNVKNILSILVLLFILFVLIFAISNLSKNNNLNANNPNIGSIDTPTPFKFIDARESLISGVKYENNFGGSNKDEIYTTYKLNNYYLIGKTSSSDFYFSNASNNAIFVIIADYNGNCKKVVNLNFFNNFEIVNTAIHNNSIYILINNSGTKLIEFNLKTSSLGVVYSNSFTPIKLVSADDLVVIYNKNKTTEFLFYSVNKTVAINYEITNFILCANYSNGVVCFFNSVDYSGIILVTKNSVTALNTFNNSQIITFNIINNGYIFLINENLSLIKLIFLNNNFEIIGTSLAPSGVNFNLTQLGNYHFLSYLSGGNLKMFTFCSHGDELNDVIIYNNVKSYKTLILNNNLYYLITSIDESLSLIYCNPLGQVFTNLVIPTINKLNIVSYEITNELNLSIFGNYLSTNNLITNNFGNQDICMFELLTNI